MKFKLIIVAALGLILFNCCKKDSVNPIFDNSVKVGSYLTLKSTDNVNFDFSDLSKFVGITVGQYGTPVVKVNLFVVDDASSKKTWTLVKTFDFTGDSIQLHVTGTEVAAALNYTSSDFLPGTTLTFYNQVVTADGSTYDINNGGPNVTAPDLNSIFSWTAYIVCPFTEDISGDYKVVQDDWNDYSADAVIIGAVTNGPSANEISLNVYPNTAAYPAATVTAPIVVDIDPATGTATIPAVVIGDYGDGYGPVTVQGSGFVFGCTGTINLTLEFTTGSYDETGYTLVLQKQ